jgi:hypothetical protein
MRSFALALAFVSGCAAVAKLDITYVDAGASDASVEDASRRSDAQPVFAPPGEAGPGTGSACPCDPALSLGCCVPSGPDAPYCTTDGASCVAKGGAFAACAGYDDSSESVCCWNTSAGAGGATSFAAACGERTTSCASASDCAGGACATITCKGVVLGACGAVAPTCP